MDLKEHLIDFFMDYGAVIYPIALLGFIVLYNRLTSRAAPEQYGFRQGAATSEGAQKAPEIRKNEQPNMINSGATEIDDDDEDDDEVRELDYESDDFERGYGIEDDDDEYQDEIEKDEEEHFSDPEDDPGRYDAYINQKETQQTAAPSQVKNATSPENKRRKPNNDRIDPLIIMYLTPTTGQNFKGYELLQALSNYGVHLSEKKHFQRFAQDDGGGDLWFHVASMTHPGTFEMDEPGKLTCNGLVFILETDKVQQLGQAYESMLETASALAHDLQGQLLNEKQAPLDENVIRKNKYYIAKHQVAETVTEC